MRAHVRLTALALLLTWPVAAGWAQESPPQRDARGPVTVAATLLAPVAAGQPVRVKVVLDTHSVPLDRIALERAFVLRTPGGVEIAPTAVEDATGGGHHRSATLVFGPPAGDEIHLVAKDVGGVAERSFRWPVAR